MITNSLYTQYRAELLSILDGRAKRTKEVAHQVYKAMRDNDHARLRKIGLCVDDNGQLSLSEGMRGIAEATPEPHRPTLFAVVARVCKWTRSKPPVICFS